MSKSLRHIVNAAICLLVAGYSIYWFVDGRAAAASMVSVGLAVAGIVVGLAGAVWFYSRSRGVSL